MNWLDVILVLPLIVGLVRGLMHGLISEVIAIVVVVLGVVGAKLWAAPFSAFLLAQFAWPQGVCDVVAYTLRGLYPALSGDSDCPVYLGAVVVQTHPGHSSGLGQPHLRRSLRISEIRAFCAGGGFYHGSDQR